MDFVQTNYLIKHLRNPKSTDKQPKRNMALLFSEIERVLTPGGQLLMVEAVPLAKPETEYEVPEMLGLTRSFGGSIRGSLIRRGFEKVVVEPAVRYKGVDYLFDEDRSFERYQNGLYAAVINIYARKPAANLFEISGDGIAQNSAHLGLIA